MKIGKLINLFKYMKKIASKKVINFLFARLIAKPIFWFSELLTTRKLQVYQTLQLLIDGRLDWCKSSIIAICKCLEKIERKKNVDELSVG